MEMLQGLNLDDAAKIGGVFTLIDIGFRIGKASGDANRQSVPQGRHFLDHTALLPVTSP